MPYPKEQMHRIAYTKLTEQQISAKLGAKVGPTSAAPTSGVFAGKTLRIVTDKGPTLRYSFASNTRLTVAENDGAAVDAGYGALTLGHVAVFTHLVPGTQRGYHVVVDQSTGLATVFEVWFSGFSDKREVQREIYFGYVAEPGKEVPKERHAPTNRVEGKAFHWRQDNGVETLEFYPSTFYTNFVELTRHGGELGFCAPSDYIKVDDDIYVYSRVVRRRRDGGAHAAEARFVNAGAHADGAQLFAEPAAGRIDASLRRLAADRFAAHDMIEVAPDGATATACFECTVETETAIAGGYTLVDMLREQGEASLRAVGQRVLASSYVKRGGEWKIASLALRRA